MDNKEIALELTKIAIEKFSQAYPDKIYKTEEVMKLFNDYLVRLNELDK